MPNKDLMNNISGVIELKKITKVYKTGDEETRAVDGIDLSIKNGEFVAIMGPSGSGKSTLMHILGLLDVPTSGDYFLDGEDVSRLKVGKLAKIRNEKIGFVFQQFNLLPRTTVIDNVILPTIYGDAKDAAKRAKELIEKVGLANRAKHKSNQLSGGQIQRVAIARALIMNPKIILADEPTGNLDTKNSKEIMEILEDINREGATIVLITHENSIAKYAKRVIKLVDGKIVADGTPEILKKEEE
jgi:putative ABC transport system ATP-binding protein